VSLPTTTELLLAWDARRPRSLQSEMGMSKLGSCRRQAGYHLQGWPQDEEYKPRKIQAVLGTAIHETAKAAARMFLPRARAESLEVHFAGLKGHPDLYLDGVLRDIKTLGYSIQLQNRQQLGPTRQDRWQSHTYAAALIMEGMEVHTIEIDYIARDSGDEWIFSEPFDMGAVEEAMAWLEDVRTADIAMLPRDFRPESVTCQDCPWFRECWQAEPGRDPRSVLFYDNPDAADWGRKLKDAQARYKAAEGDVRDAKGALDVLRTVSRPGEKEYVAVPGLEEEIRFAVNRGKRSFDGAQIAIDYKNAGARPPMQVGEPVITVALVKPKPREEK
jgi:hypothetical protein